MKLDDEKSKNPVVGVVTGGARALSAQFFSFYTRVPVKLFRPARIDYTALLRATARTTGSQYSIWTHSSPALLANAIRTYGWKFVPDKLMPPLVANSVAGSVLYTTYLVSLTIQQHTSGNSGGPPTFKQTILAGGLAGLAQAAVATPIDAIAIRFNSDIMTSQTSLWKYGKELLQKIGMRGAYGGFLFNAVKESTSFALFFSTFELIKGPVYRGYSKWWYSPSYFHPEGRKKSRILYPSFVLMGGCLAAAAMQVVSYPLSKIQKLHTIRLQAIDQLNLTKKGGWMLYMNSYWKTFKDVQSQVKKVAKGAWFKWLYGGSVRYVLYSMPSTSIGLLIFEILRVGFGGPNDEELFREQNKAHDGTTQGHKA